MSDTAVIPNALVNGNPGLAGAVLIIDDEAEIRESLQTLLEMEGFAVETAVSGEAGVQRIGEHPFDLILLDLALPGRDGMEILAEIRSHETGLPVIMITAYGTVENAVRAMQAGAANFWPMCAPQWDGAAPQKKTFN
jgi:DNA-binding NtrC family response regulator